QTNFAPRRRGENRKRQTKIEIISREFMRITRIKRQKRKKAIGYLCPRKCKRFHDKIGREIWRQWRKRMSTLDNLTRRRFVTTLGAAAGAALLPRSVAGITFQDPVLNAGGRERVPWQAIPFPMKQIRLLSGPCQEVQEANRRYLHTLPVDRLA